MNRASRSVLIVNDDEYVREGLRTVLESEGYCVEVARNGREALNKLYGGLQPALILLDLMMPVLNGFEFREEQMQQPQLRDIPVVVFSAITDPLKNAQQLQAAEYLQLPIAEDALLAAVQRHCSKE